MRYFFYCLRNIERNVFTHDIVQWIRFYNWLSVTVHLLLKHLSPFALFSFHLYFSVTLNDIDTIFVSIWSLHLNQFGPKRSNNSRLVSCYHFKSRLNIRVTFLKFVFLKLFFFFYKLSHYFSQLNCLIFSCRHLS